MRGRGGGVYGGRQGAIEQRVGDRSGSGGARGGERAGDGSPGRDGGLRRGAEPLGGFDGDGGLRHIGRHRDGGCGLHRPDRDADVRLGRDVEDGERVRDWPVSRCLTAWAKAPTRTKTPRAVR